MPEDLHAAYQAFRARGGVIDLASRVKLRFTGADRLRYLNGQLTANLAKAKPPAILSTCVTTAKGRLCAVAFVHVTSTSILLDADPAVAETLPPRMERYIIADDVTMDDATSTAALLYVLAPSSESLPADLLPRCIPANRYGLPGYDLLLDSREDLPSLWAALTAQFPILPEDLLDLLRIERGVPGWGHELDPDTLPAEAGLDATHIDFHKGCYIGQEVISRIKSVGHVNRALAGFIRADGAGPLPAPAPVFAADAPEKEIGRLTSAAHSFALDRGIALGYLRRHAPAENLFALDPAGARLPVTLHPLPFLS